MPPLKSLGELEILKSGFSHLPATRAGLKPHKPADLNAVVTQYLDENWDKIYADFLAEASGEVPSRHGNPKFNEFELIQKMQKDGVTNGYSMMGDAILADLEHSLHVGVKRKTGQSMWQLLQQGRITLRIERMRLLNGPTAAPAPEPEEPWSEPVTSGE